MPYWLNVINEKPDEAIAQARENVVQRAKDIWGLDYHEASDGLYPSGNTVGRTQFRPSDSLADNAAPAVGLPEVNGGQWRTRVSLAGGAPAAMVAAANGWGTFFDFIVDEDSFIIIEGYFTIDTAPTIREVQMILSGTSLPVMQVEEILSQDENTRGYLETPVVVSPKSQYRQDLRSSAVGVAVDQAFGVIGESFAKRSFLIQQVH